MQTILLIVLIVSIAVAIFLLINLASRLKQFQDSSNNDRGVILLNQNIQSMNERLDKNTESINVRLDKAAHVIMAVQRELGTVQERFKGFEEFSDLLHPKLRGNIGEQILSDMMAQFFAPSHYALQHKFRDGQIVDALIKTQAGSIPVDSKFPLENFKQMNRADNEDQRKTALRDFNKMVKKHIDDISKKYILPDEGTVNFAVMYVPSENVYYHILTDDESNLLEYAKTKNVLMVSPHGFFSFLRVIMMGMERNKLQEQAQKIWDILKGVQQESHKFGESLSVLSRHITNAKNAMDTTHSGFAKLNGKLDQVQLLGDADAKSPITLEKA
ncbi:MAG: DNA recombination protein RmuC [Patescibacteria group bacterium]